MSENEMKKLLVLRQIGVGTLSLEQASRLIGLSYRHTRRVWKRYHEEGEEGLLHRSIGRPSNRAYLRQFRLEILRKYRQSCMGLGPTRFAEELSKDGIEIDHETIRRWLRESGLWQCGSDRSPARHSDYLKRYFGDMVTLVTIPGRWLRTMLPLTVLYILYDEATGVSLCSLAEEQTCKAAMMLLWSWIDTHGIPEALRCRRLFVCPEKAHLSLEQQLAGVEPCTPFSAACERLGIDLRTFHAREPKTILARIKPLTVMIARKLAAGRVAAITNANALLAGALGTQINRAFATRTDPAFDRHVPIIDGTDLRSIFPFEEEYHVASDMRIAVSG